VVKISAHRGGSEHARLGTYEAYEHALSSGAEYAEFDVRKTSDGILAAYHDVHTEPAGPAVADLSYTELCDRVGYLVPRVFDVMQLLAGKMTGHVDLKEPGYEEEVVNAAIDTFGLDNFIVSTADDASISAIKRRFPAVKTALSLGRPLSEFPRSRWPGLIAGDLFPRARLRASDSDWASVNYRLARLGVVRACRRSGIGTMVWTVDSDKSIDHFLRDEHVDVLITNRPEYACRRRGAVAPEVLAKNGDESAVLPRSVLQALGRRADDTVVAGQGARGAPGMAG
jgi:glycerophosphoryl diester phosphodiesterase